LFFPLRDENPTSRTPWVTTTLLAINVAAFVYEVSLGPPAAEVLVTRHGLVPAALLDGVPGAWATLFTAMFLHGGVLHLAGNLLYLWIFGNNVEDVLGPGRFLVFYLLVGLGAHAAHVLANPSSVIPTIGASGAISGVLAAYLLRYPRARVVSAVFLVFFVRIIRVPAAFVIGLWLLLQIVGGASRFGGTADASGVAWFEHLGGFVAGLALFPLTGGMKGVRSWR
jgi:membrane associated rhomboid family serine protease